MSRLFFPVSLLSLALTMTVACTPQTTQNQGTPGDTDRLRLLYWQAPTILNPHLATGFKDFDAARIVYEPLASYDKNDQLIPFLAAEIPTVENGGIAKDGKSVTWKLKQNVKWADGEPLTAEDVVFTYQFITNPDVASASIEYYSTIEKVEAVDNYTVKITFKDVNPGWAVPFTGQNGMILPKHIFAEYNGANIREAPANQKPIGTGPYQVVEFKAGDIIIYEPNPNYWDTGKPYFKRVELKGGGDAVSAARAVLQTGDADYAYNLQVEGNILKQLEAAGKGKVVANFGPYVERIMLNFTNPNQATAEGERSSIQFPHPFFTDKKVRQAFNLAIDRDTISNQLYGPTGRPTAQILVAPQRYKSDKISYEFNLEKAAALLDEAGWKDSNGNGIRDKNGVEMQVVFQTSVNPVRQKTQEIVKQGLESIGVKVELKSIDASVFFSGDPANTDTLNHFYADLQMLNTGNDSPDPQAHMKWWTCEEITQKANNWQKSNYARYCNPEYDKLWQQATTELNPQKRAELFQKMDELLSTDVALLPIVDRANTQGVSNRLIGVEPSPWDANTWDIKNWQRSSD
ncbi:MAG: peptide ABC transporter substrate-binding protein [Limnoraphis robusta]|uniref:Peptide ABC transporter substrate-binding protein n=2 Tax=Limnoraphis robusta TaxID=1118279 RepID=A0A0F5YK67_9CYAN|nr:peptide ABC transporter substrate-binding protein [Limnoraphis robusta]KKD39319.1 peptide ABC transporter substrate-binding protein [Limnoraphis robusta CS-951]MEA5499036.1 peptide ABC transporter substrate-binding protein [Limnoraphis robusta BA-68 BA1]MEA5518053.1 peptide ABC transporter substrate-binding protein [Limnoraphis robusta CCNP1315]MEA5539361.1 peptide ABC transporter substrate-binding protein [Limnoraphis robusta Tam1]MEA5547836.1 peptide ABC transporter substrate-binding prot